MVDKIHLSIYETFSSVSSIQLLSLQPHGPRHTRPLCPSPTPEVYPNSSPLSRRCHPTISSSVVPFSCLQSFPASGSYCHPFSTKWIKNLGSVKETVEDPDLGPRSTIFLAFFNGYSLVEKNGEELLIKLQNFPWKERVINSSLNTCFG